MVVSDQILVSYLLSYMIFSVYEVARVTCHFGVVTSFDFGHRQTNIFVVFCIGFQKALSLLVYRNLWYLDAQVCLLKVLFKT